MSNHDSDVRNFQMLLIPVVKEFTLIVQLKLS